MYMCHNVNHQYLCIQSFVHNEIMLTKKDVIVEQKDEEAKGGSGMVGKMLLSSGLQQVSRRRASQAFGVMQTCNHVVGHTAHATPTCICCTKTQTVMSRCVDDYMFWRAHAF